MVLCRCFFYYMFAFEWDRSIADPVPPSEHAPEYTQYSVLLAAKSVVRLRSLASVHHSSFGRVWHYSFASLLVLPAMLCTALGALHWEFGIARAHRIPA